MKKKFSFLLLLGIVLISLTTACSKKNSKPKTNPEPSASSLINANFKTSFANGHFTQSLNSDEMNQKSKSEGLFKDKGDVTNLTYTLTQKKKSQTEQMWLTKKDMYLLLEQNKGHWIKNSINADTFDSDQVKERFDPATFKSINKAFANKATVQKKNGNYVVSFDGTDTKLWNAVNPLVIDAMNTPGSQNMQVARLVKSAQLQNLNVTYLIDPTTKKVESMTFKARYTAGGKYNFTWNLTYDQLGQHSDLAVPDNIQKDAISAEDIKKAQEEQQQNQK
ncbi:hypothetical protein CBF60_03780 [Lactobacillus taiwanensis]|uniref:DUF6612 family protein n=1 Tax=Lactobacillus taiwanensis TaxID=508451 RepID=UPI000B997353|nr:DUF6612 family protein [Lactobacillus taiwanensis]OYR96612.1 hypothetical protein CBF51_05265 [Lactobacillus taiwanensis]OYS01232.1 hypothetical protein CBF61_06195 [Lactobacillus taiwanensis]OYS13843.1 hypothetical protein CBF69_08195 [Lactobacillus taiwanensis]OYS19960.1 hypothetical protein CBF56_01860 [Lactobacillus taiwanensis]OYS20355.1 hypothetical protein CBF49_02660 [Lactobacillus taiwanensis]